MTDPAAMNAEALFEAIRNGDIASVTRLIETDPMLAKAQGPDGVSAIMLAKYHGADEIVDELLRADVQIDVFEACALGLEARTKELLGKRPSLVHMRYEDGFTLLGLAAFFGHLGTLRMLLEKGADPNVASSNKMRVRPIHSAAAHRNPEVACEMVTLLIDHGAKLNRPQHGGWTSLHQAAARGAKNLVQLLLQHGGDPTAESEDGRTPRDMALASGHEDIAQMLTMRESP